MTETTGKPQEDTKPEGQAAAGIVLGSVAMLLTLVVPTMYRAEPFSVSPTPIYIFETDGSWFAVLTLWLSVLCSIACFIAAVGGKRIAAVIGVVASLCALWHVVASVSFLIGFANRKQAIAEQGFFSWLTADVAAASLSLFLGPFLWLGGSCAILFGTIVILASTAQGNNTEKGGSRSPST